MRKSRALPLLLTLSLSACNLSDSVQEPEYRARQGASCEVEGALNGALICANGTWQRASHTLPDETPDASPELDAPDQDPAGSDSAPDCTPETIAALCEANAWQCGEAEAVDACGRERLLDCGACPGDAPCADNLCASACEPEDDATLCAQYNAQCGPLGVMDGCGNARVIQCGECEGGVCDAEHNACLACRPESDVSLCQREDAVCGEIIATDACGSERVVDCSVAIGGCARGELCNGNQCVCPMPRCRTTDCGPITNACGATTQCLCMPIEPCLPNEPCLEPL